MRPTLCAEHGVGRVLTDQVFAKVTTLAHRGLQGTGRARQAGFYFSGACKETQNQTQVRKMPTGAAQSPHSHPGDQRRDHTANP